MTDNNSIQKAYDNFAKGEWTIEALEQYRRDNPKMPEALGRKLDEAILMGKAIKETVSQMDYPIERVPAFMKKVQASVTSASSAAARGFARTIPFPGKDALSRFSALKYAASDSAPPQDLMDAFSLDQVDIGGNRRLSRYLTPQWKIVFSLVPWDDVKCVRLKKGDEGKVGNEQGSFFIQLKATRKDLCEVPMMPFEVHLTNGETIPVDFRS